MTYTEKDLVDFGRFMVSPDRKNRFSKTNASLPIADRLSEVHHADLSNWKDERKKKKK